MRSTADPTRVQEKASTRLAVPARHAQQQANPPRFIEAWPISRGSRAPLPGEYIGRRNTILALLGRASTWSQVYEWSTGRRLMPLWARAAIIAALEHRRAQDLEIIERLKALPPPRR